MSNEPYRQCGPIELVFERLLVLVDSGIITELWDMRTSSVRRLR